MPTISSNMPPVKPQPAAGTQTSDCYGNVISTRPEPTPYTPPSTSTAPTSDQWGNVISPSPVVLNPPLPPGAVTSSNMPPVHAEPAPGTQTSDQYGNVISTRPEPAPYTPPSTSTAPTCDRYGNVISPADSNTVEWK